MHRMSFNCRPSTLKEVILHLQNFLMAEFYEFNVRRDMILADLLMEVKIPTFHPMKRAKVNVGAQGIIICVRVHVCMNMDVVWSVGFL